MNAVCDPITLLTKKYGFITRSRGYYQYTQKGVRLTDLWLDGGRAILGWNTGGAKKVFKNELDRTGAACFETVHTSRFERALAPLFTEYDSFRLYASPASLERAVTRAKKMFGTECLQTADSVNTAFKCEQGVYDFLTRNAIPVWRPWQQDAPLASAVTPLLVVVPPYPWGSLYVLACTSAVAAPSSDTLSSGLLAALTRSVYDLRAELPLRSEKGWSTFDKNTDLYWKRRGPYLFPIVPREKYLDFFCHCLDNKLIISPDYDVPSIVPYGIPAGNFSLLRSNPFCWQG